MNVNWAHCILNSEHKLIYDALLLFNKFIDLIVSDIWLIKNKWVLCSDSCELTLVLNVTFLGGVC
jgi:hypothetical protein